MEFPESHYWMWCQVDFFLTLIQTWRQLHEVPLSPEYFDLRIHRLHVAGGMAEDRVRADQENVELLKSEFLFSYHLLEEWDH